MDAATAKHALRQSCLSALRAVPMEQREHFSTVLRAKIASYLPSKPGAAVALYAPLAHEVNVLPLLCEHPACRYLFPRCLPGRKLSFHHVVSPEHELAEGAHGILAPLPTCPLVPPEQIALIVVPGLAFTGAGQRLGYGGGYYDRFLPLCKNAVVVAAAFPQQILPALPTEPHDLAIPCVLTV